MALRKCHRWIRSNWRKFHKMCLLELEWSLPCLGMVHIRTSGETRDSFLEGINCLANTAAVQPFCVNVCVKNRICQFGELGWNHSILPVFFFLHNIYSCSLPWLDWVIILVIVSCETQHDSHCTFQCFSNMKKNDWGGGGCFCFVSPVTLYSPVTKAVGATWTLHPHLPFSFTPSTSPSLVSLLPEAVH